MTAAPIPAPVRDVAPTARRAARSLVWVGNRRVDVHTTGTGSPLLFLHGWGLSPRAYDPALQALAARGHQVIAPALPGFGRSAAGSPTQHTLHGVATHMAAAIEALGLNQPLPTVAHSFGAGVALRAATLRPDLFTSLTLIGPVGGAAAGPAPWPGVLAGVFADANPKVTTASLRDFIPAIARNPLAIAISGLSARNADLVTDLRATCAAGIPVRLVFADGDRVVRPGGMPTCAAEVTTETVPGGHGWLLSDPDRFARLVTA